MVTLDPPELDGLPVESGPDAEEDANKHSSHDAECASQKGDDGGRSEAEALAERDEFRETGDFQRTRSVQAGTGGAASMAIERADDEFGCATMAGCTSFVAACPVDDSLGHRHGWPPEIVLSLISCFRHKGFFFRSFSNRKRITKARYCKDDSYK